MTSRPVVGSSARHKSEKLRYHKKKTKLSTENSSPSKNTFQNNRHTEAERIYHQWISTRNVKANPSGRQKTLSARNLGLRTGIKGTEMMTVWAGTEDFCHILNVFTGLLTDGAAL